MPVPTVAEPISRIPTRETVAATLRGWIIDGTLAPEEVLRDADLAQAFGISRTPVREALLHLEHEGLVESQPGRWTRVTPLDPAGLDVIFPVWVELEALAARLAAVADGAPDHAAIDEAARAYASAVDDAAAGVVDARAICEADARFHDAILKAAHNPSLSATLAPLRLLTKRYEYACPRAFPPASDSVNDHAAILTAVCHHDPDAATIATRDHLRHTHQRLSTCWGLPTAQ